MEDLAHLFFTCPFSTWIWILLLQQVKPARKKARPLDTEVEWILNCSNSMPVIKLILKLLFNTTIYNIWTERNKRQFNEQTCFIMNIYEDVIFVVRTCTKKIKATVSETQLVGNILVKWDVQILNSSSVNKVCQWVRPLEGWWAVSCDGSLSDSRASYGGLVRDCTGDPILAFYAPSSKWHVLWAEMLVIHRGVLLASSQGYLKLKILSDSKHAVDILKRTIDCPWRVLTIAHDIWKILQQLELYEIAYIWWEANKPADLLASMDGGTQETIILPCDLSLNVCLAIANDKSGYTYNRL